MGNIHTKLILFICRVIIHIHDLGCKQSLYWPQTVLLLRWNTCNDSLVHTWGQSQECTEAYITHCNGLWTQWWYFFPLRVQLSPVLGVKLKPKYNLRAEHIWSAFKCVLFTCFSERGSVLEACLLCSHRLFGGLVLDIKRKAPWYWSDYQDALSLQCLASFLFLYCACMSPVITFGGLLGEATEGRIVRTFNHYSWSQRRYNILWWLARPLGEKLPGLGLRTPESFCWITMYSDFIPSSNTVLALEQTHFCLNINFCSWSPSWIACCPKDGK